MRGACARWLGLFRQQPCNACMSDVERAPRWQFGSLGSGISHAWRRFLGGLSGMVVLRFHREPNCNFETVHFEAEPWSLNRKITHGIATAFHAISRPLASAAKHTRPYASHTMRPVMLLSCLLALVFGIRLCFQETSTFSLFAALYIMIASWSQCLFGESLVFSVPSPETKLMLGSRLLFHLHVAISKLISCVFVSKCCWCVLNRWRFGFLNFPLATTFMDRLSGS